MLKSVPGGTGFEGMRGCGEQLSLSTMRGHERPFGECTDSGKVEASGLKGSWREAEAWHCVAGSESLKKAQKRLPMREHPSCNGDWSILEMPVLWDDCQEEQQQESVACLSLSNKLHELTVYDRDRETMFKALWSPEACEWSPDMKNGALYGWTLVLTLFDCHGVLVIPSWSKKMCNLHFILQDPMEKTREF